MKCSQENGQVGMLRIEVKEMGVESINCSMKYHEGPRI